MESFTIREPDDFHVHLRDGPMLGAVAPYTARQFRRALVMPNLTPPVLTGADADAYRGRIQAQLGENNFKPLMAIKIVDSTTPKMVYEARKLGVIAGKLYPEGVTTNSEDGVRSFEGLYAVFRAMADCGMVLCLHGESPGVFVLDREEHFIEHCLLPLLKTVSNLKVVLEHATTARAVELVPNFGNLAVTITAHHLFLTLDDVIGGMLEPHHFCKPVAKRAADRAALVHAATSGRPRIFLGTDSAPHDISKKECRSGCAGVFTAFSALELVTQVFDERHALSHLENFTSRWGAEFYDLPLNDGSVTLRREPLFVPETIGATVLPSGIRPFRAGQRLPWTATCRSSLVGL